MFSIIKYNLYVFMLAVGEGTAGVESIKDGVLEVVNFLKMFAVVAGIALVVGYGFYYMFGNEASQRAKKGLIGVFIGLAIVAFGAIVVEYVVEKFGLSGF